MEKNNDILTYDREYVANPLQWRVKRADKGVTYIFEQKSFKKDEKLIDIPIVILHLLNKVYNGFVGFTALISMK